MDNDFQLVRNHAKKRALGGLLLASLLVAACGSPDDADPSAPEKAQPVAGESPPLQEPADPTTSSSSPGRVILTPTSKAPPQFQRHPVTGRTVFRASPVQQLVRYAYDIDPRDTIWEVPLDLATHYNVVIEPPDRKLETTRGLLRKRLEDEFNVEAKREYRAVPVLLMQRTGEDNELPAPASGHRRVIGGLGRFEGRKASLEDLVRFTRTFSERPVVDQTGLVGSYDIVMEWDPDGGRQAFLEALAEHGLELVPGIAPVPHLVIRRPASDSPAP